MNSLQKSKIEHFYHSTPIHYLSFIARDECLRSKLSLFGAGFETTHLRRTSNRQDVTRGFADYIHSTVVEWPPILKSKLNKGFPHVRLIMPSSLLPNEFDLCRFNIAKGRYLKSGSSPLPESKRNGKYYDQLELPVARTPSEQLDMLEAAKKDNPVIEVLVKGTLNLSADVKCQVFSQADYETASNVLKKTNSKMNLDLIDAGEMYLNQGSFDSQIGAFIDQALSDPHWKGNGLDYDKLT